MTAETMRSFDVYDEREEMAEGVRFELTVDFHLR